MDLRNIPLVKGFWSIFLIFLTARNARASYGYSKRMQHVWQREFKSCAGKLQSPIAISSFKSVVLPLPALEMVGYRDYLSGTIGLKNNGHSVALGINKETLRRRLPYIFGAALNADREYELEGLHFHWGMKNNRGSEHILNGVRFPMEMHIIHRNMKYSNLDQALQHEDGLAVLAMFFQVTLFKEARGNLKEIAQLSRNAKKLLKFIEDICKQVLRFLAKFQVTRLHDAYCVVQRCLYTHLGNLNNIQLQEDNNERLWPIVKSLPNIRWIDSEESMNGSFILQSLIPDDINVYYTYRGSLTTPPCNEAVTWIVFPTPVPISFRQMEKFRVLSNGEAVMADNYRFLQDIGKRKVYVRRLGPSFASDIEMINLNVTNLDWYWR